MQKIAQPFTNNLYNIKKGEKMKFGNSMNIQLGCVRSLERD